MRHGKKVNHLSRKAEHRHALLRNLTIALITHKRITTTLAKAKALRRFVEPLISKSKVNTTHSRRVLFSYLQNKGAIDELFDTISAKVMDRPGGYLRVIRTGFRPGDGSEMAMIEFVDFNDVYDNKQQTGKAASSAATRRRRRRGGSKGSAQAQGGETQAPAAETETE